MTTHTSLKMLSFVSIFTVFLLTSQEVSAAKRHSTTIKVGVSVVSSCAMIGLVRLRNGACVKRV